ncbi:MAG: RNA methyltransferase [Syntrophomonadaceae bacterium]|nr:RNA methyltransferase [Syntrophomonadaceae bacterium]
MEQRITSRHNSLVKYVRALSQRKFREQEGRFVIEGVRLLEEAVKATAKTAAKVSARTTAQFTLETVFVSSELVQTQRIYNLFRELRKIGSKVYTVPPRVLEVMAETVSPQGIVGVVRRAKTSETANRLTDLTQLLRQSNKTLPPLILVLDRIQDPGNLGTLLRTAEAAGVDEVWLTRGTVDPFSAKVLRSTMGSIFRVPLATEIDYVQVLELSQAGLKLVATEVGVSKPYYQADLTVPLAILLGNEGSGLAESLKLASQEVVNIPLAGEVESLNVAVAGAILLFEARRQRSARF